MLYRKVYLQDNYTLADAGTRTVDVNITDPITALWIKLQATNGGTANKANTLAQCLSKVELIDGADVLYSLDGMEAYAMACHNLGHTPKCVFDESAGDPQVLMFPMMFGLFLGDKARSFDPTRFSNPQLRFTWNLAAVNAVGANGFLTATLQLSIIADVMEGAPKPASFLMHKEFYTWTSAAAGWEYIDLPTDYPYRGMVLRCVKADTDWHWIGDQIRINCDGGKFIAMDLRGWDLEHILQSQGPRFQYNHVLRITSNDDKQFVLRCAEALSLQPASVVDLVTNYNVAGHGEGRVGVQLAGGAAAGNDKFLADVQGFNPYDCVYVPFGLQDTPSDWFPASTFSGIKLEIRGGVAAASDYLVLTQDRRY